MKAMTISLAKKLGYVCAVLVILAAILVAVSRVFIPTLDKHRPDFEVLASQILGAPVTIRKARFSWYQYQPEITFSNLTLLDKVTNKPTFQIKKLRVFISIPHSLWQHKFVLSGIMLSGSEMTVDQSATGELSIQGLSSLEGLHEQAQSQKNLEELVGWLTTQPRIMLRDVDVHFQAYHRQKRFVTISNLRIENDGDNHVLLARAVLHQDVPTEVSLVVRGTGQVAQPETMQVKAYIYFSGLSLSQWAKEEVWQGWHLNHGLGSAKIWLTWDHGAMQQVQSIFQLYDLQLVSDTDKSVHKINRLSGDIGWKRQDGGQIFAADDLLIDLPRHYWPVSNFYVSLVPNHEQKLIPKQINTGYFNITDVLAFLDSSPALIPAEIRKTISTVALEGNIQHVRSSFPDGETDWHKATLETRFSGVNILPWHTYPGVKNLDGLIRLNNKHANVAINSKKLEIKYDSLFLKPIWLNQLNANLDFQQDSEDNWSADISSLQMMNSDLDVTANGKMHQAGKALPVVDLKANFAVKNIKNLHQYFPMRVFEPGLVEWLQTAFLSGHAMNGVAVLQGPLNEFPFDHDNGKFNISTDVEDVNLHYAPDWPVLKHVNANVKFSGRKIDIQLASGELMGIMAKNVQGTIPYLGDDKPAVLYVKSSDIHADFSQGLVFLRKTPLNKTVGRMFKEMDVSGPITVNFGLTVPFANTDDTQVQGDITLSRVLMNLVPWHLQLKDMSGVVHFTEKTTDSDKLSGELFNKPIILTLETKQSGKESIVQAKTNYNLSISDLESWLKIPFSKMVSGAANVNVLLDLSLDKPIGIHLQSDLEGVAVNLPLPYAKTAADKIKFSSVITIAENKPLGVRLNYNNLLNLALILNSKGSQLKLTGANLRMGSGDADWPDEDGLFISGHIDALNMEKIKSYATQSSSTDLPDLKLKEVDITAKSLAIFGQNLSNVRLQVEPVGSNWNIGISNEALDGRIEMPANLSARGLIKARFDKLTIDAKTNNAIGSLDIASFPAIDFAANNVIVNTVPLGHVEFNMVPVSKSMTINSFVINSKYMNLNASGNWAQSSGDTLTHLQGTLAATNVSALLNSFGYDVRNFVSNKGSLKFNLAWPGAPFSPALDKLNGNAALELDQGRIVELGETGGAKMELGRLLSIFSLQTIPRRLSLDFSDLSQKGYSFDFLRGDFKFDDGDIFTDNTRFDGPVARVDISGRIGVADKDVDLTLSVTPNVTASLPVAATLISGPIAGLAALAVNTVVSSAVSSATTHYYSVKGSWNDPQWNTLKTIGGKRST